LNYEILDQSNKKQIIHVNRLKQAFDSGAWKPKAKQKAKKKPRVITQADADEEMEEDVMLGPFSLLQATRGCT
jgi:hypothetical protein